MRFIKLFASTVFAQEPKTMLGRWRCVGSQKNGKDIIELKMTSKENRYKKCITIQEKVKLGGI